MNQEKMTAQSILGATIGGVIEWYDFACYGYFAVTIGNLFFPSSDPTISLLLSFLTFGMSFFMRPVGGIIFGSLGDRIGRKPVFAMTVLFMTAFTFLIGVLPTYSQVGILAPILLILLRLLQAVSAGGELTGAFTYALEHSKPTRRGLNGAFVEAGGSMAYFLGTIVALIVNAVVPADQMDTYGWRIPFWFAGVLGIVGIIIRMRLHESPVFEKMKSKGELKHSPIKEAFKSHKWAMVFVFGLACFQNVGVYMENTYFANYLSTVAGFSSSISLISTALAIVTTICVMPFFGILSDRIGRVKVLTLSTVLGLVAAYPIFLGLSSKIVALAIISHMFFGIIVGIFIGTVPATMPELFPANVRYGGMSVPYNISVSIFGGLAPTFSTLFIKYTGNPLSPAYYIMIGAVITGLTLFGIAMKDGLVTSHKKELAPKSMLFKKGANQTTSGNS
ncbi:MFS transporter [Sporolactobacillus sp. THM7-4]|nr:MFS transporter [Sporolactobacillus sp. THM7-4]